MFSWKVWADLVGVGLLRFDLRKDVNVVLGDIQPLKCVLSHIQIEPGMASKNTIHGISSSMSSFH